MCTDIGLCRGYAPRMAAKCGALGAQGAYPRQAQHGWNITGDTYVADEEGYFWYQARSDDMIISAGYNIAGPEIEAALLTHAAGLNAGWFGTPDPERRMMVTPMWC